MEQADPQSLERQVRQLLADKISGNQVGIWLLLPEHLRLGTWDLLCGWTAQPGQNVEPRLALQLIHESALCTCNRRQGRSLSQKGFELANGLPFVASDQAIHELLSAHTVEQALQLQIALGRLRRASGHFQGQLLALDPHRLQSYSKRLMRRHRQDTRTKAYKVTQTFFCLDVQTGQPLGFTIASAARTVAQATPELLALAQAILQPVPSAKPLVLADCEHYDRAVVAAVQAMPFDLLVPLAHSKGRVAQWAAMPAHEFTPHWAGYATAKQPFYWRGQSEPSGYHLIQRSGELPGQYHYKGFLATADRPELAALSKEYPERWQIEEFFKFNQALGWQRAGTLNLNIRYGHMTMALIAQALIHQLRQRLGEPFSRWDAKHFADNLFGGLEGDVRVDEDRIIVTYYNAPNADLLRAQYENLPEKLAREGVQPEIPWLYNYKLDFRFK